MSSTNELDSDAAETACKTTAEQVSWLNVSEPAQKKLKEDFGYSGKSQMLPSIIFKGYS